MKKILRITVLFMYLISILGFSSLAWAEEIATNINISPIVQVISYKSIYGKYVQMLGWGSASIINNQGILITNSHVVDDGKGNLADIFSICVTKKTKEKPVCDYTASLIIRDEIKDIAILKIEAKDVNGKDVNYENFKFIEPDFNYIPKNQDDVVAVGYPRIGADTITETKGIISGITKYNNNSYIKTDTVIAGGNSGGGLINKEGKLIGVPTFVIGGFFDSSLGYALSINEIKEFVQTNMTKAPVVNKKNQQIDFNSYKSVIDKINADLKINDDIFDIQISNDYEVKNYIKNRNIEIQVRQMKDFLPQYINFSLEQMPSIKTDDDFFYFLQKAFFYSKKYQKLKKEIIGGLTFYYPISISDKSQGKSDLNRQYVSKIGENLILRIYLDGGRYSSDKYSEKAQEEIKKLLDKIKFHPNENIIKIKFDFALNTPQLSLKSNIDNNNLILDDYKGFVVKYLDNLHELFSIYVNEKSMFEGKGQSVDETYKAETNEVDMNMKSLISLNGHRGYIYCDQNGSSYYGDLEDEKGNPITISTCDIKIIEGFSDGINEYYLEIKLMSEKNKIEQNLDKLNQFLADNLIFEKLDKGETKLVNIFKNQINLKYSDIEFQSLGYKEKLKVLVKYNLIPNTTKLEPEKPLKWIEFILMYLKMIYKFDFTQAASKCKIKNNISCILQNYEIVQGDTTTNLAKILESMKIDLNAYVNLDKIDDFSLLLEMKLAGVNTPNISQEYLTIYNRLKEEKIFETITKQLNEFNNKYFGKKKIGIYEVAKNSDNYLKIKEAKFINGKGVVIRNLYDTGAYDFTYKNEAYLAYQQCLQKVEYLEMRKCIQDYNSKYMEDGYNILTKGDALDYIVNKMDFGLYDEELAKKKDVIISE